MPEGEVQVNRNIPGRTVETLREEMLALFVSVNKQIDERVKALQSSADAAQVAQKEAVNAAQLAAKEAVNAALAAQKEGTASALAASDRAVTKAEGATERRFEAVNEFRAQLGDQARTFMPRAESEVQYKALMDKFNAIEGVWGSKLVAIEKTSNDKAADNSTRLTTIEGKGQGMGQMVGWIALSIGVVIGLIEIARFFIK